MCIGNEEKYQSCQSQKIILNNFDFEQYSLKDKSISIYWRTYLKFVIFVSFMARLFKTINFAQRLCVFTPPQAIKPNI